MTEPQQTQEPDEVQTDKSLSVFDCSVIGLLVGLLILLPDLLGTQRILYRGFDALTIFGFGMVLCFPLPTLIAAIAEPKDTSLWLGLALIQLPIYGFIIGKAARDGFRERNAAVAYVFIVHCLAFGTLWILPYFHE